MEVDILRFSSPTAAFWLDGKTEIGINGKNHLVFLDEMKTERKLIIEDDVKPFNMAVKGNMPWSKESQKLTYVLCRDNFISVSKDKFKVTGAITNEQITQIAEWGMIEALVRATKNADKFSGMAKTLLTIVAVAGVLIGAWALINWVTGGALALPF